jgi:hypothetical protein
MADPSDMSTPPGPGLRVKFVEAAKGSQEKVLALPDKPPETEEEKRRKERARHIDVRTDPVTRRRFYLLYHRWASGRDDVSMDAYLQFLLDGGERAMNALAYRPHPFNG